MSAHETAVRVRYGETDQMGVVYHADYLLYFEEGRTDLLRSLGIVYALMEREGYALVVTEAALRYRSHASYDDVLRVRTRVTRLTPIRVRFDYELLVGERRVVEGHTVLACLGPDRKPRELPVEVQEKLRGVLHEPEGDDTRR